MAEATADPWTGALHVFYPGQARNSDRSFGTDAQGMNRTRLYKFITLEIPSRCSRTGSFSTVLLLLNTIV